MGAALLMAMTDECMDCGLDERNCQCEDEDFDDWDCTHCGGDGTCDANANPLWDCDEQPHTCHACRGTGRRRDQVIF
jgi:hypothetical protein